MEEKEIIDGRSYSHEILENYRFRAIELYNEGKHINEIAHFFGVHRGSVSSWITTYNRKGKNALKSRKSSGRPRKIAEKEMKMIINILQDNAMQHGFETPLWTCKRLQQVMRQKTGKKLHTTNVMRWLKKWGMTNQKPKRRATQQDEEAVKKWLANEWPRIKAHKKRWQALLYFQDESGVSLTAVMGKTWAPKGKTPIVKVTGKRGGICVTSAISPAGHMVFRIEKPKERINSGKHIEFLEQIMKSHPRRKIIVIEDRAPPHIAKKVDAFVENHSKRFAIYRLPSYSPELNPDEHVWEYLK
ncbi:MAG: IS630 family transposase, partial [Candidatus Aenigmarchaeota archaeon]|nr:IS630 family transposase [Candidatus Aenigmarchaeota archaeon]MDI6722818.1 IS630 family transposase [Candidatus Aenigmarchaeota archaeon]